jgi:uncharacterized membrane protein
MAEGLITALGAGLLLAASYNPLAAVIGAAIGAGLAGAREPGRQHMVWAVAVLGLAWLVGDGAHVIARARDVYDDVAVLLGPPATLWENYVALALWAVGGLALGYVLPAWTGAFVGRRVTHGTGWVSAVSIAVAASLALAALVTVLGG